MKMSSLGLGRLAAGVLAVIATASAERADGPATDPRRPAGPEDRPAVVAAAAAEVTARVYERGRDGSIVERWLRDASPGALPSPVVSLRPVTARQIEARLPVSGRALRTALDDVAPATPRLVPEDLTRRAHVFHVAVEHWTEVAFALLAARVGQAEGFSVVARLAPGSRWAEHLRGIPNLAVIELPGPQYIWTEDVGEVAVDGTFQMIARMGDRGLLRRTIFVERVRRFYPQVTATEVAALRAHPGVPGRPPGELPLAVMRRFPDIMFMIQGLVDRDTGQAVAAALAVARGAGLWEASTYLEGGNVLLGTLPGGDPYALVGRDSAAVSRALLERRHHHPLAEAEVVAAIAKDLGIDPARVFFIEQPGVFHLDMAMTLLAPGTVVLNDAREALRLQIAWMRADHEAWRPRPGVATPAEPYLRDLDLWREAGRDLEERIRQLTKYADRFARYEDLALVDLQAAGLRVRRVAGRFLHPTLPWERDLMNFLNGEAGRNAAGETYFITQGGDPRAERYVAARLLAPGSGLDRLYLAPRLASRDTLWEKGGIGCRLKAEGEIVPPSGTLAGDGPCQACSAGRPGAGRGRRPAGGARRQRP